MSHEEKKLNEVADKYKFGNANFDANKIMVKRMSDSEYLGMEEVVIDDLIITLNKMKEQGATHLNIDFNYISEAELKLYPYCYSLETDHEHALRVESHSKRSQEEEQRKLSSERAMYEKLKKQFEG